MILFGGVLGTSERFMNVENDAKAYYIGVLLILILQVCSFSRKGLSRFIAALSSRPCFSPKQLIFNTINSKST